MFSHRRSFFLWNIVISFQITNCKFWYLATLFSLRSVSLIVYVTWLIFTQMSSLCLCSFFLRYLQNNCPLFFLKYYLFTERFHVALESQNLLVNFLLLFSTSYSIIDPPVKVVFKWLFYYYVKNFRVYNHF